MKPAPSSHASHGGDRAAILRVVEPIARAHGAEVVDVELKPERGGTTLRVTVEKAGASAAALSTREAGVSLELCANVSRDLSPALDVADIIPHAYRLEVSSPGIERPLRGEGDFMRFRGLKAKIKRRVGADSAAGGAEHGDEGRVVVGIIDGVIAANVRIVDGKRIRDVPLSSIESARLVFEFGSGGGDTQQRKH